MNRILHILFINIKCYVITDGNIKMKMLLYNEAYIVQIIQSYIVLATTAKRHNIMSVAEMTK